MDVVRDVLNKPVVDRNGREMGRVDGILMEVPAGEAPRLTEILIGPSALGYRLHPTLGRWIAAIEYAFGVAHDRPVRIEFTGPSEIARQIQSDLAISETAADAVERRLRAWIAKIPGSG